VGRGKIEVDDRLTGAIAVRTRSFVGLRLKGFQDVHRSLEEATMPSSPFVRGSISPAAATSRISTHLSARNVKRSTMSKPSTRVSASLTSVRVSRTSRDE
jgi:hypothetical protein